MGKSMNDKAAGYPIETRPMTPAELSRFAQGEIDPYHADQGDDAVMDRPLISPTDISIRNLTFEKQTRINPRHFPRVLERCP
jgi:hypothetical protein